MIWFTLSPFEASPCCVLPPTLQTFTVRRKSSGEPFPWKAHFRKRRDSRDSFVPAGTERCVPMSDELTSPLSAPLDRRGEMKRRLRCCGPAAPTWAGGGWTRSGESGGALRSVLWGHLVVGNTNSTSRHSCARAGIFLFPRTRWKCSQFACPACGMNSSSIFYANEMLSGKLQIKKTCQPVFVDMAIEFAFITLEMRILKGIYAHTVFCLSTFLIWSFVHFLHPCLFYCCKTKPPKGHRNNTHRRVNELYGYSNCPVKNLYQKNIELLKGLK